MHTQDVVSTPVLSVLRRARRSRAAGMLRRSAPALAMRRVRHGGPLLGGERHWEPSYAEINDVLARALADRYARHRPCYLWPTLHAARLARALGVPRITVVEFGVFGGDGLVALEAAARRAQQHFGVAVDAVGFDAGKGLPTPVDSRDLPNVWPASGFTFDPERVRARLTEARLIEGWIEETLPAFLDADPAPLGFLSIDVDQYHATKACLAALRAAPERLLPRVHCYFDDILGYTFGDLNGERLAIREFNEIDDQRQISKIYGLQHFVPWSERSNTWPDQVYLAHILDHPDYDRYDGLESTVLASRPASSSPASPERRAGS